MIDSKNMVRLSIEASSPCCGKGMLAYGLFYGSKIYMCRNCFKYVERRDALLSLRMARRIFREIYKDAMIRFEPMPSHSEKAGDTVKFEVKP